METPTDLSSAVPVLLFFGLVLVLCVAVTWRRRNSQLELAHRVAQDRAESLLKDVLTPEEYAGLGERGYLEVRSPSLPARTYCVPRGRGRVAVQEDGLIIESLCVAPVDWLPPGDVVLTHKLMIEGDEQEYLRRANRYRLKVPAKPPATVV
jgi:hypothetical protein